MFGSIRPKRNRHRASRRAEGVRLRNPLVIVAAILLEVAGLWLRAHTLGGNVVVRCRKGHLFTTIWIPAASMKSLRLGWWRLQHCPVGHHWSLVTPVNEADLTDEQKRVSSENRDIRIP
ncbi:MAG: hypothetical protein JOZ98_14445 [Solirubrobacterales bacterium]|nr:hypothetical protein [Solirubrobacterales bacterium]MBV9799920.1 hypothetical protein [Solirubrobacterales bacterium]